MPIVVVGAGAPEVLIDDLTPAPWPVSVVDLKELPGGDPEVFHVIAAEPASEEPACPMPTRKRRR